MFVLKSDVVLVVNPANGPFGLLTKFLEKKLASMLMDWNGLDQNGKDLDQFILNGLLKWLLFFLTKLLMTLMK